MAQLAQPQSHIVPTNVRTRHVIVGAILALLVAGAVVLALTLPGGSNTSNPSVLAPSARISSGSVAAVRSDGGPEEGTRGAVRALPTLGLRFDGGPQEGTRGVPNEPQAGTRSDGGPDEGSRARFGAQ
jgi:hypothetical protein